MCDLERAPAQRPGTRRVVVDATTDMNTAAMLIFVTPPACIHQTFNVDRMWDSEEVGPAIPVCEGCWPSYLSGGVYLVMCELNRSCVRPAEILMPFPEPAGLVPACLNCRVVFLHAN